MQDTPDWWTYRARPDPRSDHPHGVVDGDTLDLELDQGLSTYASVRVRLARVDTAEIYGTAEGTAEHEAGESHRRHVRGWLEAAGLGHPGTWPLVVRTSKDTKGKYGRLLAAVRRRTDGDRLAHSLTTEYPDTTSTYDT